MLEDDPDDAELIKRHLMQSEFLLDLRITQNESGFKHFLNHFRPELILADYRLPDYSGLLAMDLANRLAPGVPFVFITGAVSEEIAEDTILAIASGFVLKSDLKNLKMVIKAVIAETDVKANEKQDNIYRLEHISDRIKKQIDINNAVLNRVRDYLSADLDLKEDFTGMDEDATIG